MKISVVIIAMNNQDSIVESMESILSQRRMADQVGAVLGPSYDSTRDFIDFYRDELDFCRLVDEPRAPRAGRGRLRLRGLRSVDGSHVLFVPADVFMYPEAIERFEKAVRDAPDPPDCVFGSVNVIDAENEVHAWGTDRLGPGAILGLGPINSASVFFDVSRLKGERESLEQLGCGPFSTLGWVLTVLSDPVARAICVNEPLAELWSFREGPFCWDRTVSSGLLDLVYLVEQVIPDYAGAVASWVHGMTEGTEEPVHEELRNIAEGHSNDDDLSTPAWYERPIPFSE